MPRRTLFVALNLAWALAVLAAYHLGSSSFPPGPLPALLRNTLVVGLVGMAGLGGGWLVLRAWPQARGLGALSRLFETGAGLGSLAIGVLAIAGAGLLYRPALLTAVLALAGVAVIARPWRGVTDQAPPPAEPAGAARAVGPVNFARAALLAAGGLTLAAALAPPEFYDALIYHLVVPEAYLRHHSVVPLAGNYYSHFPANMGMLYAIGLSLSGAEAAQALHWLCGLIAALALYATARRHTDRGIATLATALFALNPGILLLSTQAGSDLGVTMFGVLALAAALEGWRGGDDRFAGLAGLFGGFALGTKYTAAISVCLPAAVVLMARPAAGWAGPAARCRLRRLGLFLLVATAALAPWLTRNALVAGHPLAPYFGAAAEASASPTLYDEAARRLPGDGGPAPFARHVLRGPWSASMERLGHAGYLGPIFLVLLPAALVGGRVHAVIRPIGLAVLAGVAAWSMTSQVTRYLFPIVPWLAVMAALGARRLPAWLTRPVIAWSLVYGIMLFGLFMETIGPYRTVTGLEDRDAYLGRRVSYYEACRFLGSLPADPRPPRILFLGEGRTFYCPGAIESATPFDLPAEARFLEKGADAREADLAARLAAAGITHLLVSDPELRRLRSTTADAEMARLFPAGGARLLFEASGVRVYALPP